MKKGRATGNIFSEEKPLYEIVDECVDTEDEIDFVESLIEENE